MSNKDTKNNVKDALYILWRFICGFILTLFVVGVLFIGIIYAKYRPKIDEFKNIAETQIENLNGQDFKYFSDTQIYDRNGKLMYTLNQTGYEYVKFEDLPKYVVDGYIAVEDKNFYVHNGVDYKGMLRAAVSLVKNRGKITQGGSTITQQVLKNNVIGTKENKYVRKLKEVFMASDFEKMYDKNKIMEIYVNTNSYGNQCMGIQSASKYYFNKPVKDLDPKESAFLVGLSNAPSAYNPKTNPEKSEEKVQQVLKIFKERGVINEDEYKKYKDEKLNFVYARGNNALVNSLAVYSMEQAADELIRRTGFIEYGETLDKDKKQDYNDDYKRLKEDYIEIIKAGGYKIYTSIDQDLQNQIQEVLTSSLERYTEIDSNGKPSLQGAIVTVDNKTGMPISLVGSRQVNDQFNRAFRSVRQPGSAIKPILVYAPAMETGKYFPSRMLMDKEISIKQPNGKVYAPRNSYRGYKGEMNLRDALARSTNTIAVTTLQDIKPEVGMNYLEKMNFRSLTEADKHNISTALGGFTVGVTPLEMAKGYSTLANSGEYNDVGIITKIEYQFEDNKDIAMSAMNVVNKYNKDVEEILSKYVLVGNSNKNVKKQNNNIFNSEENTKDDNYLDVIKYNADGSLDKEFIKDRVKQIYSPETSYMTISLMEGVVNRPFGTAKRANAGRGIEVAGKTGTTNSRKDAWFVGITPDYTTVVWLGHDQPKEMNFYGGDLPVTIWNRTIQGLITKNSTKDFYKPKTVVFRNIDAEGLPTEEKTGQKDIFSKPLLDKYKKIMDEVKEQQRMEKEKELIGSFDNRLDSLDKKLKDLNINNLDESIKLKEELEKDIKSIGNEEIKNKYLNKLASRWSEYENRVVELRDTKKEMEETELNENSIDEISRLMNKLNQLNKEEATKELERIIKEYSDKVTGDYKIRLNNMIDRIRKEISLKEEDSQNQQETQIKEENEDKTNEQNLEQEYKTEEKSGEKTENKTE